MAEKNYRILVINPGSTSTKVGVFDGETEVFTKNVAHEAEKLAEFKSVSDQMPYRRDLILEALAENDVDLSTIDAFVGRGGGLLALEGGTYTVSAGSASTEVTLTTIVYGSSGGPGGPGGRPGGPGGHGGRP